MGTCRLLPTDSHAETERWTCDRLTKTAGLQSFSIQHERELPWGNCLWGLQGLPIPRDLWGPVLLKFRDFYRESKLFASGCRQLKTLSWVLLLFWDKVSLYSPGWAITHFVAQVTSNLQQSSCPSLPSSGTTGTCHLIQWDPDFSAWFPPVSKAICPGVVPSWDDGAPALSNCQTVGSCEPPKGTSTR